MKNFVNIQPQHPQQHPQMLNGVVILFDEEDKG